MSHVALLWGSLLSDDLKGELEEYVQKYLPGKIKVIRNTKREGLIRGRMIGAAHATGTASCRSSPWVLSDRGLVPGACFCRGVQKSGVRMGTVSRRDGARSLREGSSERQPLLSQNRLHGAERRTPSRSVLTVALAVSPCSSRRFGSCLLL